MKLWQTHISEGELHEILVLLKEGYSIPKVAEKIGRQKSTLYRLFSKNNVPYGVIRWQYVGWKSGKSLLQERGKCVVRFYPETVHSSRQLRRSVASRHYHRIHTWSRLEGYILEKLKNAWSPKQISGRWTFETWEKLSKDTIYRFIYSTHRHLIAKYLRRKGKRYQRKRQGKYQLLGRRMIDERPGYIEKREDVGHWEWDTIVWIRWGSKEVILTHVERKTGYLLTRKLLRWTGQEVLKSTRDLFDCLPETMKQSITYDNGREFSEHRLIEYFTKATVYFAHPYHSWERGTNENTNGLLRQFIPKKTDMKDVSTKELENYTELLNHRPRERLWFRTPYEVFMKEMKSCIWL